MTFTAGEYVLAPGQIIFVEIPEEGPHPVVVIHQLDNGYLVANGTGSPQDEKPVVSLSLAAAKICGLTKPTAFYAAPRFVWLWRPANAGALRSIGRLQPTAYAELRAAVDQVIRGLDSISRDIGKLPPEAGVSLAQLKQLAAIKAQS